MALYLTWARRNAPEAQAAITAAYSSIARELGATLVPAGLAWERSLKEQPEIVLHDKDNSHPTLAGSYLAACVFFAVLFDDSPIGIATAKGIDEADAQRLQRIAAEVVHRSPQAGRRSR
jgi:hypothetical protein